MADLDKALLDGESIRRALTRIAHEIVERNKGVNNLVLVGLVKRGDVLANRIAKQIESIEKIKVPVGSLDITFHRDDTNKRPAPKNSGQPTDLPFDVQDKIVVLVDDVLFTGRSIRAAMDELNDYGRSKAIQLAVLIDRGHRELPIHADFVGKNIPTSRDEKIDVVLDDENDHEGVFIKKS